MVALVEHCPGLTSVDLEGCEKLTGAALKALAEHCPGLSSVNLGNCGNLTDAAAVAFA